MILILSNNTDVTTNEVIDWLIYFKFPFVRINETDVVKLKAIKLNNKELKISLIINNDFELNLDEVSSYWYRRGFFNVNLFKDDFNIFEKLSQKLNNYNLNFHRQEYESVIDFLHLYLKTKKHINSF